MQKFVILAGLLMASPAAAQVQDLHLLCQGTGDHQVAHKSFGTIFGDHGSADVAGVSHSQEQFGEQMDVEITAGVARARVPRRFLPPAHGGDGGWFEVKGLVVSADDISGTVLINFVNHPKLRIDRRSGTIQMDGKVGAFSGQCQAFDPAKAQRAF